MGNFRCHELKEEGSFWPVIAKAGIYLLQIITSLKSESFETTNHLLQFFKKCNGEELEMKSKGALFESGFFVL